MPDTERPLPLPPQSRAVSKRHTRLSLVWVIPIVAAIAGAWVAVVRILGEGPSITLQFNSAEGLEAGKTKIEHNGVVVGTIMTIRLTDDHEHVIASAQMAPKTQSFLVEDTRFWVVRPRISGSKVSGLGTLISGAYVAIDIGKAAQSKREFTALEAPPIVAGDVAGRFFTLKTPDLGSLDTGTPLYFRRMQVGQVASFALDPDGHALTVKVFVRAPYDQYVTSDTRFWHASGVDVSLSADGLRVQTQSALSVLIGGIAFETPASGPVLPPADADTAFTLFADRADAFKPASRDPQTYVLVFKQSLRGLVPGAPVEFRGIPIGEVVAVSAHMDAKSFEFSAPVTIRLDPQRLGVGVTDLEPGTDLATVRRNLIDHLVAHGARAQLQSGNLLTGALFVAFDFFPDAPPATVDWSQTPVELPTLPGQLAVMEASLASIMKKIDQLPFKAIGDDLRKAIADLDLTLVSARGTLDSANKLVEPNSALGSDLGSTLDEVKRAAQGLRVLLDYLERHPDALIRGKKGEAK